MVDTGEFDCECVVCNGVTCRCRFFVVFKNVGDFLVFVDNVVDDVVHELPCGHGVAYKLVNFWSVVCGWDNEHVYSSWVELVYFSCLLIIVVVAGLAKTTPVFECSLWLLGWLSE